MRVSNLLRSRAALLALVVVSAAALVVLPVAKAAFAADSPDCDSNAVVYGGASTTCNAGNYSTSTLIAKIQNGDSYHSASNIQGIYNGFFSTSTTQLVSMLGSAQMGYVTSSGNVVLNGQTVATNVWTAGRQPIGNSVPMNGVYMRPPSVSFLSSQLQAYIMMSGSTFKGAILLSCGNPVYTINKPFGQIFKRVVLPDGSTTAADDQAHAVSEAIGSTFQYSVDVTNNGTADMTNTVVTDDLPAGVALANGASSHIVFSLGTIPAGSQKYFTITAKVTSTTAGQCINNIASFTADQGQTGSNNAWICVTGGQGGGPSPSPSPTGTPTVTPTPSNTPTPSTTPTPSNTPTPSTTPTPSGTPTPGMTCQPGQVLQNGVCTNSNLPQTGPETGLAGMGGMGAMGYAARAYLRSKKSLLDTLRRK